MRLALLTALALALIVPSSAFAAGDFYVQDGGTGAACTQIAPCGALATALTMANVASGGNVHVIGQYTDHTGGVVWPNVHLLGSGSGPGGTFLDVSGGALALNLVDNATADGVRLRSDSTTVAMQAGGAITNSAIETTSTALSPVNIGPGPTTSAVTLQRDTVTAPATGTGAAVIISPGGFSTVIQDSALTGVTGLLTTFGSPGASLVMQRSTINASSTGLWLSGVAAFVSRGGPPAPPGCCCARGALFGADRVPQKGGPRLEGGEHDELDHRRHYHRPVDRGHDRRRGHDRLEHGCGRGRRLVQLHVRGAGHGRRLDRPRLRDRRPRAREHQPDLVHTAPRRPDHRRALGRRHAHRGARAHRLAPGLVGAGRHHRRRRQPERRPRLRGPRGW